MKKPVFSIVTVAYNAANLIEKTILSVVNQSYDSVEYIIIDGKSTDNTLQIINKYISQISTVISEKDNGIYDAMNKGLKLAKGDYVLFLNAGDLLFQNDLLLIIANKMTSLSSWPIALYGETLMIDSDGNSLGTRSDFSSHKLPNKLKYHSFVYGMTVCHQSIFISLKNIPLYNLEYRYSADIDWILNILKNNDNTFNLGMVVSKFLVGGVSDKQRKMSLKERFFILKKHYGLIVALWGHWIIFIRAIFLKIVR